MAGYLSNDGDEIPKQSLADIKKEQNLQNLQKEMQTIFAEFKERDYRWLWYYLDCTLKCFAPYRNSQNEPHARFLRIAKAMLAEDISPQQIKIKHAEFVLAQHHFDWINQKDTRQLIFINFLIFEKIKTVRTIRQLNHSNSTLFERIIDYFDITHYNMRKRDKISALEEFQTAWNSDKAPLNLTKWIDEENPTQLEWALEYLKKKNEWPTNLFPDGSLYPLVLVSLDIFSRTHSPEATQLFITKMSRTWSQKKFRDAGKNKNPYQLPLTKDAKKKLDQLSEFYNTKSNAILEELINQEYKTMLDANGKKKY